MADLHVCPIRSHLPRKPQAALFTRPGYGDAHHLGAELLFGGRVQGQSDPRVTWGPARNSEGNSGNIGLV